MRSLASGRPSSATVPQSGRFRLFLPHLDTVLLQSSRVGKAATGKTMPGHPGNSSGRIKGEYGVPVGGWSRFGCQRLPDGKI